MKIAFLSFYSGRVPRGIETFVHELANRLARNHEVTVFQCGPKLPGARYQTNLISTQADWEKINGLRHLSTLIFFDFNLANLARRFYLDSWSRTQAEFAWKSLAAMDENTSIIISAGSGWVSFFSRFWCWLHSAKLIIAGQSGPGWDDRINLLCRPDAFVALTKYQSAWAQRNSLGVRVEEIPNGVDLEKFGPEVKKVTVNLPRPVILCVAALDPGKRVELTIKAVSKLKKGSLLVLGRGKLKAELDNLAAKLLPGRYLNLAVSHDQMPAYYSSCDLATMVPPRTESFGIVFLEAMASNIAVVASDDPPRREIIGRAGLFVDPENIDDYAKSLEKALKTDWADLPRRQAGKFSWDVIATKYDQLFRNL